MVELPSTLLRHDAPPGGLAPHYDWLILDPAAYRDPGLGLWTARVQTHWRDWGGLERIELAPLPRHRRRYLDWAGPLSDRRGWVRPAGRGLVQPILWTPRRIELSLSLPTQKNDSTRLSVSLQSLGGRWLGTVTHPS
ncbi:MAG: hypothetical protein AAGH99_14110 [Planctomycetota bacterium]